jgi:hypothetical protein
MADPMWRNPEEELVRLRQLRDAVSLTLRDAGLSPDAKLRAIERTFQDAYAPPLAPDEDELAEEERDRERIS